MRRIRTVVISGLGLGVALTLSACGLSAAPAGAPAATAGGPALGASVSAPAATSAPAAVSTAPSAATPAASPGTSLVPMQTSSGGIFLSPTGNIDCEVDYQRAGQTVAYCQTQTPPESVRMDATGSYTTCKGVQCLANPDPGNPTLAYGTATGVGPFLCTSATTGVTCTANGKGFQISRSGIVAVSA